MPDPSRSAAPLDLEAQIAAVDEVLSTTRSIRRRLDFERPVEPEVLEACIDVAVQAPTGIPPESWRFLVVDAPERKRAVADCYRAALDDLVARRGGEPPKAGIRALADRLHEVPALVLVCAEGRPPADDPAFQLAFYGSVLPAAWSLMLALRARGLGSTWTTLLVQREREVAELLDIPAGVSLTVLLPVGYMRDAVLRPAARAPAQQVSFWNTWGARRGDAGTPESPGAA
ncbi:MAG: nitroreductase family protein [Myxococcota bacterium]